jgi:hypothetical protein
MGLFHLVPGKEQTPSGLNALVRLNLDVYETVISVMQVGLQD